MGLGRTIGHGRSTTVPFTGFRMEITGLDQVIADLRKLPGRMEKLVGGALRAEMEEVMRESERLVPRDTDRLYDSRHVGRPFVEGDEVVVEASYNTPYATYQHENLGLKHPPKNDPSLRRNPPGAQVGRAKYLEIPLAAKEQTLVPALRQRLGL